MSATAKVEAHRSNLNPKFCHGGEINNGFNPSGFIDFIHNQLEDFIEIFNLYLDLVTRNLSPNRNIVIDAKELLHPDKIYSFNYTNTYQRIHKNVVVDFLHGSSGKKQNIVLGISDLEDESLKRLKAYGFTKYHQRLFKDTDYLFLDIYKKKIQLDEQEIIDLKDALKGEIRSDPRNQLTSNIDMKKKNRKLDLNLAIWGHSLDISDKDYIIDLFSLNDDMDRNVKVTVYYFNKSAKFSLLNNLLAILGKDKVEYWMKNKWLQFKENPEIRFLESENQQIA